MVVFQGVFFCISWSQKKRHFFNINLIDFFLLIVWYEFSWISNEISLLASFYARIQSKHNLLSSSIFPVSIFICISFYIFVNIYISSEFRNHIRTISHLAYIYLIMSDQKGTLRIYKVKQRNGKLSNWKQRTNIPKQTGGKEEKKSFLHKVK